MLYGEGKRLQMARSILPSSARVWAQREKRIKNKKVRHGVKQDLRRALFDEDFADNADLFREPSWSYYVRERQGADKLNHFEKWAVEITRHIDEVDGRRAYIRSVLPPGLIGWHAMSHLDRYNEFLSNPFAYGRVPGEPSWRDRSNSNKRAQEERRQREYEERVDVLSEITKAPGGHRLLNRYLIQKHRRVEWVISGEKTPECPSGSYLEYVGPERPRLLRGLGDIEDFLEDLRKAAIAPAIKVPLYTDVQNRRIWGKDRSFRWENGKTTRENPDRHPEWVKAVNVFVAAWTEKRGDLTEVSKALGMR